MWLERTSFENIAVLLNISTEILVGMAAGVRRTEATERRRAAIRSSSRRVPNVDHVVGTVHGRRRLRR